MNAVVLKVENGKAVVLTQDGDTREIAYEGKRGDRVEVPDREKRLIPLKTLRRAGAIAAAAAVVIVGTGAWSYTTVQACSYVTLDVNPSFEYTLNRLDRVIGMDALNEEANPFVEVLKEEQISGKTLTEAIEMTTELLEGQGYLDQEKNEILVSVTGKEEGRFERLNAEVTNAIGKRDGFSLELRDATMEDRKAARECGISTGQYLKGKEGEAAPGAEPKADALQQPEDADSAVKVTQPEDADSAVKVTQPGETSLPAATETVQQPAASAQGSSGEAQQQAEPSQPSGSQPDSGTQSSGTRQGADSQKGNPASSQGSSGTEPSPAVPETAPGNSAQPSAGPFPSTDQAGNASAIPPAPPEAAPPVDNGAAPQPPADGGTPPQPPNGEAHPDNGASQAPPDGGIPSATPQGSQGGSGGNGNPGPPQ